MANQKISGRSTPNYYYVGDLASVTNAADQDNTVTTALSTDLGSCDKVGAFLIISSVTAGAAGDTLDVAVQGTLDPFNSSPAFFDIIAFDQISLNALSVPAYRIAQITHGQANSFNPATALAAGSNRQMPCMQYRIKYTVVDAAAADLRVTFRVILRAIGS